MEGAPIERRTSFRRPTGDRLRRGLVEHATAAKNSGTGLTIGHPTPGTRILAVDSRDSAQGTASWGSLACRPHRAGPAHGGRRERSLPEMRGHRRLPRERSEADRSGGTEFGIGLVRETFHPRAAPDIEVRMDTGSR